VLIGGMLLLMFHLAVEVLEPREDCVEGEMDLADFGSNVVDLPRQIVDPCVVPIHAFR